MSITTNIIEKPLPREMQQHTYAIMRQVEETHWWFAGRRRIIKSFLERLCRDAKVESAGNGGQPPVDILDVGCGTGANLEMLSEFGEAVGVDISGEALTFCRERGLENVKQGEAEALPFEDSSFEAVTIAFGLRNLTSVEAGFNELRRVLKPGGRVAVLEFSKPKAPVLRSIFRIYFTKLLPLFGGLISGSKSAYEYLPDSVSRFPEQEELATMMNPAGFTEVSYQNLTGGIAALHLGTRPLK